MGSMYVFCSGLGVAAGLDVAAGRALAAGLGFVAAFENARDKARCPS